MALLCASYPTHDEIPGSESGLERKSVLQLTSQDSGEVDTSSGHTKVFVRVEGTLICSMVG